MYENILVFQSWAMQNWKGLSWDYFEEKEKYAAKNSLEDPILHQVQKDFIESRAADSTTRRHFRTFIFPQERLYSFSFYREAILKNERLNMNFLYLIDQSLMVNGGKCACLFSSPEMGMFRVFFSTNEDGVVAYIYVDVYEDLWYYCVDVGSELSWINDSQISGKLNMDPNELSFFFI